MADADTTAALPSTSPLLARSLKLLRFVGVVWTVYACMLALLQPLAFVAVHAFGASITLTAWWITRRQPKEATARAAVNAICGVVGFAVFLLTMLGGQNTARTPFFLSLLPLIAVYVVGRKAALQWSYVAVAELLLIHLTPHVFRTQSIVREGLLFFLGQQMLLLGAVTGIASAAAGSYEALVDQLKKREETIKQQRENLEKHAEELTVARDQALAASRAKGEFLANMSHELRTPLNAVLGMTTVLEQTALDPVQREHLETIRSSGSALLDLISDLLDYTRSESGQLQLESLPTEPRAVVEEAMSLVAAQAAAKKLELGYRVASIVPHEVLVDRSRWRQILVNLLSNAVKFTEKGRVDVEVTTEQSSNGIMLECTVRDSGIGLTKEQLERLFQPFTQADSSIARKYGGSGLGLAICKSLATAMGGGISASSEPGKGATFRFSVATKAYKPVSAPVLERPAALRARGPLRVLVWLKHEATRALATEILRAEAASSREITGVSEMVTVVRDHRPEVVLTDVELLTLHHEQFASLLPECSYFLLAFPGAQESLEQSLPEDVRGRPRTFLWKPLRQTLLKQALRAFVTDNPSGPSSRPPKPVTVEKPEKVLQVLVAEDNEVNQKVVRLMLQQLDHQVTMTADGVQALEKLRAQSFDVVLLDLQMPVMDGIETAKTVVREWQAAGKTPPRMIAVTANALAGDRERCIDAGMHDYLSKPLQLESLRSVLSGGKAEARTDDASTNLRNAVDLAVVEELRSLGGDLAEEVLELWLKTMPERLKVIKDGVAASDWKVVASEAHALKGSSGSVGALRVMLSSSQMETAAREKHVTAAQLEGLERDCERAEKVLRRVLMRGLVAKGTLGEGS